MLRDSDGLFPYCDCPYCEAGFPVVEPKLFRRSISKGFSIQAQMYAMLAASLKRNRFGNRFGKTSKYGTVAISPLFDPDRYTKLPNSTKGKVEAADPNDDTDLRERLTIDVGWKLANPAEIIEFPLEIALDQLTATVYDEAHYLK